jgi:hypothetical protein
LENQATTQERPPAGRPDFAEGDLKSLKVLRRFREVLDDVLQDQPQWAHRSFADPKRKLLLGDYLSLFLLGMFNPVARTVRGLAAASRLPGVQRGICRRPVSLGSFSEAQALVEPALLAEMFAHVSRQLAATEPRRAGAPAGGRRWLVRDSSLFSALPRMSWALYGGGRSGAVNNAVRLHVSFSLQEDAPVQARMTTGKACERAALRADLQPGDAYIGDRYYGEHYAFFTYLQHHHCKYLIRLLDRGREPAVEEELPCTAEDAAAGVERQAWVRLGNFEEGSLSSRLRLLWVRGVNGQLLHLVTNLPPEQLSAADAALLYKERWQIEYFFRWVKCLLAAGRWHWLAESPQGAALQFYLVLIAAVLLQLDLGRRPSKRVWELYQWYLAGMMDEKVLAAELARQLAAEARRPAAVKKSVR